MESTHNMGSKLEHLQANSCGLFNSIQTCTLIICCFVFMKTINLAYKELINLRLFYYTNLKIKNKL